MIWALGFVGLVAAVITWGIVRDRRELRRWRAERDAIALMHEILAQEAVRPNGHVDHISRH